MSWWKVRPNLKDTMVPKKKEFTAICPHCKKVLGVLEW